MEVRRFFIRNLSIAVATILRNVVFAGCLHVNAVVSLVHLVEVLRKPDKPAVAQDMLKALSTKTFSIFTGLAFVHKASDRYTTCVEETKVTLGELTPTEISTYVASGVAMSKCGAIDVTDPIGSIFCAGIIGDPNNLHGLPLRRLYRTLKKDFADLFEQE